MTTDETMILMIALTSFGPAKVIDFHAGLDCSMAKVWMLCDRLHKQGALDRPRHGQWLISEKGRIACALAMYKDRSLAAAFFDEEGGY